MKTLEQLKQEAKAIQPQVSTEYRISAEHREQRQRLEVIYRTRSQAILENVPEAVIQAEAREVRRAIIGIIHNDQRMPGWPAPAAESWHPLESEIIPPLVRSGLPQGVRLQAEDSVSLFQGRQIGEGCQDAYFMGEKPRIKSVYVPGVVAKVQQVRQDALLLVIRWD